MKNRVSTFDLNQDHLKKNNQDAFSSRCLVLHFLQYRMLENKIKCTIHS